ncbi:hypothetical protein Trydic_g6521 [Trypoxylus dichotomus]
MDGRGGVRWAIFTRSRAFLVRFLVLKYCVISGQKEFLNQSSNNTAVIQAFLLDLQYTGTFYFFAGAKNPMLYYDNFLYKVVKRMPYHTTWLCVSSYGYKCKAVIRTSKEGAILTNLTHNHPPVARDLNKSVYSCVMNISRQERTKSWRPIPSD